MFNNQYHGKTVLITGNTGFKGSWLTTWLLELGAKVIGVSKDIPTKPSMFEKLNLADHIKYYQQDIRDLSKITTIIANEKPDFIFHLAAQPIVSTSYSDPIETISSNVMGTANVLEALRTVNHKCIAIIITSDKAYDNVEQIWGYKEDDKMGGKDIYSGSKGAAELIIKSYFHSFFKTEQANVKIAIGRAGNVIGGGDWASDRIVVDCVSAWSEKESVEIRCPAATRPWQHVLEPLSGYLSLAKNLSENQGLHGEAFNFGPQAEQNRTVLELIKDLSLNWNVKDPYKITGNIFFHEASLLKLNCDKALGYLNWHAVMDYKGTVKLTSDWYIDYYQTEKNMFDTTVQQIKGYQGSALKRGLKWMD